MGPAIAFYQTRKVHPYDVSNMCKSRTMFIALAFPILSGIRQAAADGLRDINGHQGVSLTASRRNVAAGRPQAADGRS